MFNWGCFVYIESQRPANKRRKRKGSNSGGAANNAQPAPNKKRSPGPNFSLASQVSEKKMVKKHFTIFPYGFFKSLRRKLSNLFQTKSEMFYFFTNLLCSAL